jgi:hypothetical protein
MSTQQQLTEARNALHQLMTGTKAVKVQKDGRSVEFTPINISALRQYINQLEQTVTSSKRRRPAGVSL